jgi:hypothetical protein
MTITNKRSLRLFHGTTAAVADLALTNGLTPRGNGRRSNWEHTIESNPDTVYLTDVYGAYFAFNAQHIAADHGTKTTAAVIELRNSSTLRANLVPDEDFLEQATRGNPDVIKELGDDMLKRTRHYRAVAREHRDLWPRSLAGLGTVGHLGPIAEDQIIRVAYIDPVKLQWLTMFASDATITIMNHHFCGEKYLRLTEWIFGKDFTTREWLGAQMFDFLAVNDLEALVRLEATLAIRDGIRIVQHTPDLSLT